MTLNDKIPLRGVRTFPHFLQVPGHLLAIHAKHVSFFGQLPEFHYSLIIFH
jgi:hypothetical protein